tara:strand:+ start:553 stop:795 length:243 start_codon:yes stop_codon:yes gene_type:complete
MYQEIITTRIAGIPAKVGVTHIYRQAGSFLQSEVSDLDYHGYVEFDYDILDMRGKRAVWLERKLTDKIRSEIEQQIAEVV